MSYSINTKLNGTAKSNCTTMCNGNESLRIAIIGQSNFAADVLELLLESGYNVVGVFTIPDKGNREDILATTAKLHNISVFKFPLWRRKGVVLDDVLEQYKSVKANLNVLPFCSQFIPMEVIDGATHGSICYHPSVLPRHRGASAISWTLIEGDEIAGFSIFWADDGLDTGPLLLTKQCNVESTDTLDSIYKRFLYPEGVKSMKTAVDLIAQKKAPKIPQIEFGATYEPPIFKVENQIIDLNQPAYRIFNFIRALDSVPGAIAHVLSTDDSEEESIRLFGACLYHDIISSDAKPLNLKGLSRPALINEHGLLICGTDGNYVNVKRIMRKGRMIGASEWFNAETEKIIIELTDDERVIKEHLKKIWQSILNVTIDDTTNFLTSGAGSMDIVRLVEEVKDAFDIHLEHSVVFMSPVFDEFLTAVILAKRIGTSDTVAHVEYNGITINANKRHIHVPTQLFINGQFTDGKHVKKIDIVNPTTEEVICQMPVATVQDVDYAVKSAYEAFKGPWSEISARQRGAMMMRLADLMEKHKEELATIEAVDSGAVYTLALKTHVGMSIEAWRFFAGCCDKIEGSTIPVSAARPNNVLTFTKREPIGVCGIITPWNYPLMMLSWKMAACIGAGNTVVLKPAQVSPLTALKFVELTVLAGFPSGVINILPGTGSVTGQAIADHPLIRKLGFTGSTEIGKTIMTTCAQSNLKKCSLELGGKSPLVIFADCDLEKAVKYGMSSVFFNKGENCISAGRLFVEDKIHDEFVRRVLKDVKNMKIGDPLNRSTAHGPQNHKAHFDKLHEFCEIGVRDGAKLICGGERVPNMKGFFFQLTVFTDVEDDMYIAQEESFGPIMIISKFSGSDIDGVIRRANKTEFGLASGIFTKDLNKALLFADKIEAGTVFVNVYNKTDVAAPFGGFKQSGFGKDLGQEALNEYLKTKCVTIEY
ncbi:cytosolic 10-formyltetrahydrofolate dehydrogenase [Contarinia nasturtii]|uniref:cytosolic 10-formyltetrahydrofolate dehydrogenase n=1 Tax=Contarinia nasturtii TaxID=265458 RepID=UPI0012D4B4BF|nr:cytosolic 10-formyltetrahydrofolate dehydrogenase [Contarinia nasturtii]